MHVDCTLLRLQDTQTLISEPERQALLFRTPFFFTAKRWKNILNRELNFNVAFRDNALKPHTLHTLAHWVLKFLILLWPCHSHTHTRSLQIQIHSFRANPTPDMTVHDQIIFFVQGAKTQNKINMNNKSFWKLFISLHIYTHYNPKFTFVIYKFSAFTVLMSTVKLRNGVTQTYPHPVTRTSRYDFPFIVLP
jgi:hypothetical protein